MPVSDDEGKNIIGEWLTELSPEINHVLDIGCGVGTYFNIFGRQRKHKPLRHCKWTGIEVWQPYVDEYGLKEKYHELFCEDLREFDFSSIEFVDLAFAGDVLEHVTKEEAIECINKLFLNCKRLIISIPIVHYPQDEIAGNPYEKHVKDDYSHEEIMESFPYIQKFWQGDVIGVYYLEKP